MLLINATCYDIYSCDGKLLFLCLFTRASSTHSQTYQIPTMQNGPDLAKRFYKELTDMQVGDCPHTHRASLPPVNVIILKNSLVPLLLPLLLHLAPQYGRKQSDWAPLVA